MIKSRTSDQHDTIHQQTKDLIPCTQSSHRSSDLHIRDFLKPVYESKVTTLPFENVFEPIAARRSVRAPSNNVLDGLGKTLEDILWHQGEETSDLVPGS